VLAARDVAGVAPAVAGAGPSRRVVVLAARRADLAGDAGDRAALPDELRLPEPGSTRDVLDAGEPSLTPLL
jgi:hypothetical protein